MNNEVPKLTPAFQDELGEIEQRMAMLKQMAKQLNEKKGFDDMIEEKLPPEDADLRIVWTRLVDTYRRLKASKPNDRSEKDRRMAVAITKYEDMLSWYHTMVLSDFEG